jgi:hypothetical protein
MEESDTSIKGWKRRDSQTAILAPDLRGANGGGVSMASYLSTELTVRAAAGLPTSSDFFATAWLQLIGPDWPTYAIS